MSETVKPVPTAQSGLTCNASAEVRRRLALEALIAEVDGEQVRDFIMGNPRPALESDFEDELWKAGFKNAFCKVEGEMVEIAFDFEAQPVPPLHHLAGHIRRIAAGLRPGESCGTISSVRRGNHAVLKFKFEPCRGDWEQFSRYRQRRDSGAQGGTGTSPESERP